ncbi:unnamed protein product [Nippostrongylus brasiliensis]|uniref:Glycine-rich cell wall structural protein-like n=1 Tax=Nippostrongylus brasiliensis TaxID=27835 RepID=A0A0N4XFQ7_NIPBR|nr:unnamed protein product [Nippostrongylus brasiliensis]
MRQAVCLLLALELFVGVTSLDIGGLVGGLTGGGGGGGGGVGGLLGGGGGGDLVGGLLNTTTGLLGNVPGVGDLLKSTVGDAGGLLEGSPLGVILKLLALLLATVLGLISGATGTVDLKDLPIGGVVKTLTGAIGGGGGD